MRNPHPLSRRTISGLILSQELACLPQVETDDAYSKVESASFPDPSSEAAAASLDAASESGELMTGKVLGGDSHHASCQDKSFNNQYLVNT